MRALIAEDEHILALTLQKHLQALWPELEICALAENGNQAVELALQLRPDILFFDIKMPVKTGLEAVRELAEEWPEEYSFPQLVFVTAYDEFAVDAFDTAAADYVMKPVHVERLQKTIQRIQARLNSPQSTFVAPAAVPDAQLNLVLNQLRHLLPQAQLTPTHERLSMLRAAVGNQVRMIAVDSVLYFEATDKYINIVTREHSSLIRTSLRELLPQLDASQFWQIHRSTVVNIRAVKLAYKDESGKFTLELHESKDRLAVSRVYAHLFKQM